MRMKWAVPDVAEYQYGKPPSIWWYVVAFVVIQVAGIVVTVLNWEQGKSMISGAFFGRAVLVPLLLWGGISAWIYSRYEDWVARVDWWNHLCRLHHARRREWACAHVAILGSVVLTPEPDLAERLLGLEGRAPKNPGKVMALPELVVSAGVSRMAQVIEQLIKPLTAHISNLADTCVFDVILHSDDPQHAAELQAVWRKLGLSDLADLRWAPFDGKVDQPEQWFDPGLGSSVRLVLGCQLHIEGKEPSCSEIAAAMLLAPPKVVAAFKGKLKPQARLFRPISTPSDSVADALERLLSAEQTARARIRHGWSSGLSRQSRHATSGAIKDAGLNLAEHDLDGAIGEPGPVSAWLLQALAAQMVEHGQGAQLVASPQGQDVTLNLVGTRSTPVSRVGEASVRVLDVSVFIGLTCGLAMSLFLFDAAGASDAWFLGASVVYGLSALLTIVGCWVRHRVVEDDFDDRLRCSTEQA
ncbi:hypothetical protein [Burkholderia contaminans]|uniref:Type VI secretion protein n=1 Tax=Burkholderia contaminans TaxID=488447 RepID=A0A3N8Q7R2_9BURK|nr:hypothetical protein [Burkholderia contaminans]RQT03099.1 hypothetical protein DF051_38545 [Burkholderia contaminans]